MENEKKEGILLVVDDEPDVIQIYKDVFTPIVKTILCAVNGQEALNYIKSGRVDAVLTDITMPVMTGLEFLAQVRALCLQTPIVVLTGYGDKDNILEALRLDATDFLEKPIDMVKLVAIVSKALEYGIMLNDLENVIDLAFANTTLPKEEINKLKKVRKMTAGLRAASSVYIKGKAKKVG